MDKKTRTIVELVKKHTENCYFLSFTVNTKNTGFKIYAIFLVSHHFLPEVS